ncbi:hypothetical protein [Myxococcus landrumensis]|uniref:Uncharacterized protein n=1 Tax=Myxococcus landrumensis TaxID=2813577 RepID=A0ABX7N5Y5_9BACT|nr:hypothetical protein [Myxococcus landrumus]QSQ14043.1 hypothetical protein JY572_37975 [Myxococcus landrumus]
MMNGPDDFNAFLATLSPEEQQQLMALGTLDERDAQMQQQMALAEMLGKPRERQYSTGAGAAMGELANGLRMIHSQGQLEKLQAEQAALLAQKDAGRNLMLQGIQRYGQPAPTYDVSAPVPFTFGG